MERFRAWGTGGEACGWTAGRGPKGLGSLHFMLIAPEAKPWQERQLNNQADKMNQPVDVSEPLFSGHLSV